MGVVGGEVTRVVSGFHSVLCSGSVVVEVVEDVVDDVVEEVVVDLVVDLDIGGSGFVVG